MTFIEVRVACDARAAVFELHTDEASIGGDSECTLQIFDPSIASQHVSLLVRRRSIILAPSAGCLKGVRLADQLIRSPVVIEGSDVFELGRVTFSARLIEADSPLGQSLKGYEVSGELESEDADVRRYWGQSDNGESVEIALLESGVPKEYARAWLERIEGGARQSNAHLRKIVDYGYFVERPYAIERIGEFNGDEEENRGLRLSQVDRVVYTDVLCLPVEAVVAILAQVADGLAALHRSWGPHGALEPRTVNLGVDGAVNLIRPGPRSGTRIDNHRMPVQGLQTIDPILSFLGPERRMGMIASKADDVWALGALARHLLGRRPRSDWPLCLDEMLVPARRTIAQGRDCGLESLGTRLREGANALGLDPSVSHVSRLVKLLISNFSRPLGLSKWTRTRIR